MSDSSSETMVAERRSWKDELPRAGGHWIGQHTFVTDAGSVCIDYHILKTEETYKAVVNPTTWHAWLRNENPVLGRKPTAFLVKGNPEWPRRLASDQPVIVWLKEDVKTIIEHRKDAALQKSPPGLRGTWVEEVWEDDDFGDCLRDQFLATIFRRSNVYFVKHRRRPHPALDPNVNGGKPRWRKVPKLGYKPGKGGPARTIVSCIRDFQEIVKYDEDVRARANAVSVPASWKSRKQIADALNIAPRDTTRLFHLSYALERFRDAHPDKARSVPGLSKTGLLWWYDADAFVGWLGDRSLKDAAGSLVEERNKVSDRRVQRAVRFLQFVLTQGMFSLRRFNRFLANPPTGELTPCRNGILKKDVLAWAKEAGIEPTKCLKRAKVLAGVRSRHEGRHANKKTYWYMPGPICIQPENPAPVAQPAVSSSGPTETVAATRGGRGRKSSEETLEVYRFCFNAYQNKGDRKLRSIRQEAEELFGNARAPKEDSTVVMYARRYEAHLKKTRSAQESPENKA
jgi:hypothetical protein